MALQLLKFDDPRQHDGDPEWLTDELMTAYFVAISVDPEIVHANALVRSTLVYRVLAGLRVAKERHTEAIIRRVNTLALMVQDNDETQGRLKAGGW